MSLYPIIWHNNMDETIVTAKIHESDLWTKSEKVTCPQNYSINVYYCIQCMCVNGNDRNCTVAQIRKKKCILNNRHLECIDILKKYSSNVNNLIVNTNSTQGKWPFSIVFCTHGWPLPIHDTNCYRNQHTIEEKWNWLKKWINIGVRNCPKSILFTMHIWT